MPYSYKNTYKFKVNVVNPLTNNEYELTSIEDNNQFQSELKQFIVSYKIYIKTISKFFFEDQSCQKLNQKIEIKHNWIKIYHKNIYHNKLCKETKISQLSKLEFVKTLLFNNGSKNDKLYGNYINKPDWIKVQSDNIEELNLNLQNLLNETKINVYGSKNTGRYSEIRYLLNIINCNNGFIQFYDLFTNGYLKLPNSTKIINLQKELLIIGEDIKSNLNNLIKFLPINNTLGELMYKASFNYNTINKEPKMYQDEINELNILLKKFPINPTDKTFLIDKLKIQYSDFENLNFYELKNYLKAFKAKAKSSIYEILQNTDFKFEDFKGFNNVEFDKQILNLSIYNHINLTMYYNLINEIPKLRSQNKLEVKRASSIIGSILIKSSVESNYKKFENLYKKISKKYGELLAQKKGYQNQLEDAKNLSRWAFVSIDTDNCFNVYTIPKGENLIKIKKEVYNLDIKKQIKIKFLHSLQFNAFDKLLFKNPDLIDQSTDNTFRLELSTQLDNNLNNFLNNEEHYSYAKRTEDSKITFYQKLLKNKFVSDRLNLEFFESKKLELLMNTNFADFQQFELEFNKVMYVWVDSSISIENLQLCEKLELTNPNNSNLDYQVKREFDLTKNQFNYNLKPNNKKPNQNTKVLKLLLDDINSDSKDFMNKLAPEFSLFKRQPNQSKIKIYDRFKKTRLNTILPDSYRYASELDTIVFSFDMNTDSKHITLGFKNESQVNELMAKSNTNYLNYIKSNFESASDLIYIGIDRGEKELLSLSCIKFKSSQYEINGKCLPEFEVIDLKKLVNYYVIDNDNINDENIVKLLKNPTNTKGIIGNPFVRNEQEVNCLDLTSAKLVNGNIYQNGDFFTYLKSIELFYKNKLFEVLNSTIQKENMNFEVKNQVFYKTQYLEKTLDQFKLENIKLVLGETNYNNWKTDLIASLNFEFEKFSNNNSNTKLKQNIKKIKSNLSANHIGIINFIKQELEKKYGANSVVVCLECFELDSNKIAILKSFENFFDFEYRLINKFKKEFGDLDFLPYYKQFIQNNTLRQENISLYFNVNNCFFVPHLNSSKTCPICGAVFANKNIFHSDQINPGNTHNTGFCSFNNSKLENKAFAKSFNLSCSEIIIELGLEIKKLGSSDDMVATFELARRGYMIMKESLEI
jgi:hypothetical protein